MLVQDFAGKYIYSWASDDEISNDEAEQIEPTLRSLR